MLVQHLREQGVGSIRAECQNASCRRASVMGTEAWPEKAAVLDLGRTLACPACGATGMITRPNWFGDRGAPP
jgi:hypothetical protein